MVFHTNFVPNAVILFLEMMRWNQVFEALLDVVSSTFLTETKKTKWPKIFLKISVFEVISEAYLKPSQVPTIEIFCENS